MKKVLFALPIAIMLLVGCSSEPAGTLIYITLDEAAGLTQGAEVTTKGVPIGAVESLGVSGSKVVVALSLKEGTNVPVNSAFGLQTNNDPPSIVVNFSEGSNYLATGDTVEGTILRRIEEFSIFTNNDWLEFAHEMVNMAEKVVERYKNESSIDDQVREAAYDSLTFYWNGDNVVRITELMDINYKGKELRRNYFFLANDIIVITFPDLRAEQESGTTGLRGGHYKVFMQDFDVKLALGPDDTPLVPGGKVYDKVKNYYPEHARDLVSRSLSAGGQES